MELGMIQLLKMKQGVERILNVPGNYRGGILEMAVVVDCSLEKECAAENMKAVLKALKSHSDTFRNVRLNVIWWKSDSEIETEVVPMTIMQMGTPFDGYERKTELKHLDELLSYLKMFQARSKLLLLLGGGDFEIRCEETCLESLKPFLGRKMLFLLEEIPESLERLSLKARMILQQV